MYVVNKLPEGINGIKLVIIPKKLFINERGIAKLEIALARGKKLFDKRESIKEKEIKRRLKKNIKTTL